MWHCLDCSENLCHGCKALHERFAVTKDHIIVPEGSLPNGSIDDQKLKLLSLIREKGFGDVHVFCKTCQVKIKRKDTLMEHIGHNLENPADHVEDINTEIKHLLSKINAVVASPASFESKKQLTDEKTAMKKEVQKRCEEVILSCKARMKELHCDIDKFYKEKEKHVKEAKSRVGKEGAKLVKVKEKLVSTINKDDQVGLRTVFNETKQQLEKYKSALPFEEKIVLQTSGRQSTDVGKDIGCLNYTLSAAAKSVNFHLELVSRYGTTKLRIVSVIMPCGPNEMCIGGVKHRTIQLVSLSRLSYPLNEFTMTFYDFTSSTDGNLLYITDFQNKSLKSLSKTGNLYTIKDFSPMFPTCVHITSQNQIFVGLVDKDSQNMDADSRRTVVQLSIKGDINADYEFDPKGIRLFTVPYRCHLNEVNNLLIVIDKYDPVTGRILAIDTKGEVRFRYSGFADNTKFKAFRPTDIRCTRHGETVICDIENHSLHILDRNGIFIQNLSTLELNISHPHSLAVDSYDQLWIGTGPPPSSGLKGQIYSTKIVKY